MRESVDLVRDEVDLRQEFLSDIFLLLLTFLILGTHPHQVQGECPAVDLTKGIVGVTVEKSPDLLPLLPLGDDGLLK